MTVEEGESKCIERLEIANRLSEEYKELVVQMQTKLQQTGSRDEFTLLEKRNALDALPKNDDDVNDEKRHNKPLNVILQSKISYDINRYNDSKNEAP